MNWLTNLNQSNSKIQTTILRYIKTSKKSIKPFKFYIFWSNLYTTHPELTKSLVNSISEWGCWKELFVLLIANKNNNLKDYIYDFLVDQLKQDKHLCEKKQTISYLAKWIPRQQSSFDKKLDFLTNICKRLYLDSDNDPRAARKKYRKLVANLNKYLDTTEIKLCSKEYEKIDFNKVPAGCLIKNMPTVMKHPESKNNLEKFLFNKYLNYDFVQFFDLVCTIKNKSNTNLKELDDFHKKILSEVWGLNINNYVSYIKDFIKLDIKKTDVILDLSKSVHESSLKCVSVGCALMAANFKNNIIINAFNPYILKLDMTSLFDQVEKINQECTSYETINLNKIQELKLIKSKKALVVTNIDVANTTNIYYWKEVKFKPSIREIRMSNNINKVKNILNLSKELKDNYNMYYIIVLIGIGIYLFM